MKRLLMTFVLAMLSYGVASAQLSTLADNQKDGEVASMSDLDKMPMFQGGGVEGFCYWVMTNVEYPAEAISAGIQGRVLVSFVVYPDGKIYDFEVVESPDPILSEEVFAVLERSNLLDNAWRPGEVDGKPVKVAFTIPVSFAMQ